MSTSHTADGSVKKAGAGCFAPRQLPPGPDWYHVQIENGEACVWITGEIGVTGQSAADLVALLQDVGKIEIIIQGCIGGCAKSAFLIHEGLDGADVSCQILGRCYSAAVIVALCASKIRIAEAAAKATLPGVPVVQASSVIDGQSASLLCTVEEAAQRLSCKHGLIRKLVRQRKLPRVAGVRKVLIPVDALEKFVIRETTAR